jgi:hypothetical protein
MPKKLIVVVDILGKTITVGPILPAGAGLAISSNNSPMRSEMASKTVP